MRAFSFLSTLSATFGLGLALGACANETATDKPEVDPDAIVGAAKADATSNYWTTIVGSMPLGTAVTDSIDYPDYYLGRTLELRAGQKIEFKVTSNRKSVVRVYGPATGLVDGQPLFGKALVKTTTSKAGGKQVVTFTAEATQAGTYMLLYGPSWVWSATYDVQANCVSGCLPADACQADDACPGDEFCGWNGVACIRAPCDVAYDICQARKDAGASCARDRECADGLACGENGKCVGGTVAIGGLCQVTSDCKNGFCGYADQAMNKMVCKAFSGEGETCGGFRPAYTVTMCSADFACVAPYNIIADIPGQCGQMTTVAAVLADPKKFDGHYIAIQGVIDPGAAMCTKMACSPANPCCNQCGANLRLFDDAGSAGRGSGIYLSENGADLGCGGNECTWRDHCAVEPGNAWVSGWFSLADGGVTPKLAVAHRWSF